MTIFLSGIHNRYDPLETAKIEIGIFFKGYLLAMEEFQCKIGVYSGFLKLVIEL